MDFDAIKRLILLVAPPVAGALNFFIPGLHANADAVQQVALDVVSCVMMVTPGVMLIVHDIQRLKVTATQPAPVTVAPGVTIPTVFTTPSTPQNTITPNGSVTIISSTNPTPTP